MTVLTFGCPCSLFPTGVPTIAAATDSRAVDVGVKFRSDVAGFVRGIRFYKGPGNTGVHTGALWSSTGTKIATATFTAESRGRLAIGCLREAGAHRRGHDVRRVVPHECRPLLVYVQRPHERSRQTAAACARVGGVRRQRCVPLRIDHAVPRPDESVDQLLGRPHVHDERQLRTIRQRAVPCATRRRTSSSGWSGPNDSQYQVTPAAANSAARSRGPCTHTSNGSSDSRSREDVGDDAADVVGHERSGRAEGHDAVAAGGAPRRTAAERRERRRPDRYARLLVTDGAGIARLRSTTARPA